MCRHPFHVKGELLSTDQFLHWSPILHWDECMYVDESCTWLQKIPPWQGRTKLADTAKMRSFFGIVC